MDELQAGVEPSLAVRPSAPVFSSQAKLRSTTHRLGITANMCNSLRLAICTVTFLPKISCTRKAKGPPALLRLQRSFAIGDVGSRYRHRMLQPLCIHGNVALDARNFLAGVIAFATGRVRVVHALRVHDQPCLLSRCARVSCGLRTPDFFNAGSSRLTPSLSGSLHLAKYECTVRHFRIGLD